MPDWTALALPLIKRYEGCKLVAYKCPAGIWTIGWGQTGPSIKAGLVWTQEQADAALLAEVERFGAGVDLMVKPDLEPHEKAALVSFAYNVGLSALLKSTLLRLLNAGHFPAAADQFTRWDKAGGRVLAGLTKRRASERALFLGA